MTRGTRVGVRCVRISCGYASEREGRCEEAWIVYKLPAHHVCAVHRVNAVKINGRSDFLLIPRLSGDERLLCNVGLIL